MPIDENDLFESILLNVQIVALDSPNAASHLHHIGETLGDEYLYIAANFLVAYRLEMMDGDMPDAGLFKWLEREYPRLGPAVEAACQAYIDDTRARRDGQHGANGAGDA